jgi:hypothetical protein
MDIRGFVSILSEIVVGGPANDETAVPSSIPQFIPEMIEIGVWGESMRLSSFRATCDTRKRHDFKIMSNLDSVKVLSFIGSIEFLAQWQQ